MSLNTYNGKDELIVFGHNDLDMLGCMLNIEYKWPSIQKKYFFTNYANTNKIVDNIEDYCKFLDDVHILITDVSFSDNKDALKRLYSLGKCTHIDHHMYPDNFWDEFPNMKVIWNKEKSATKLCNEYFSNIGKNVNLDKLTYIIDTYDLWQVKSKHFDIAQDLNEYFWKCDILWLCEQIINNDFKLPKNYLNVINRIHEDYNEAIIKLEKRKLIYRSNKITVVFTNEWFNQILINEMKNGQDFVIGVNSYGIVKIRINECASYTDEQKNNLRLKLIGNSDLGHMNAFTYKIKEVPTFDNITKEIERVVKEIGVVT